MKNNLGPIQVSYKNGRIAPHNHILTHDATVINPKTGQTYECYCHKEKHHGRLFLGFFDIKTKKLVTTYHIAMKERWKIIFTSDGDSER